MSCRCDELVVTVFGGLNGKMPMGTRRLTPPREHSCEYVRKRNAIVAQAWAAAVSTPGTLAEWNVRFQREMRRRVAEAQRKGTL